MRIGVRLLRTSPVRRTLILPGPPALDALWRRAKIVGDGDDAVSVVPLPTGVVMTPPATSDIELHLHAAYVSAVAGRERVLGAIERTQRCIARSAGSIHRSRQLMDQAARLQERAARAVSIRRRDASGG
jgi:hypothetical protein